VDGDAGEFVVGAEDTVTRICDNERGLGYTSRDAKYCRGNGRPQGARLQNFEEDWGEGAADMQSSPRAQRTIAHAAAEAREKPGEESVKSFR
ncbi:MAG: hypothetical protein ACREKL_01880, partial [Chthoniobacterales bacterium]